MKNSSSSLRFLTLLATSAAFAVVLPIAAAEGGMSGEHAGAAKTITVKGKFVTRDGINLLENIEIVP